MTAIPEEASTSGHEPFHLSQAAFVTMHALLIASYYVTMPLSVFTILFSLVAIPALWFVVRSMKHRPITCTHCIRKLIAATDDPSQYSPVFRGAHLLMRPAEWIAKATRLHPRESSNAKIITVSIISVAAVYTPAIAAVALVPFPWQFLTAMIGFTLTTRILNTHERLIMFCPQCRGGGGGHDDHTPQPTPQPSAYIT